MAKRSGFTADQWDSMPRGKNVKSARRVWVAVKQTTGTPPTLLRYIPPSVTAEDGTRLNTSRWEIHHEGGNVHLIGPSARVIADIEDGAMGAMS